MVVDVSEEPLISVFRMAYDWWLERWGGRITRIYERQDWNFRTVIYSELPFIVSLICVSFFCPEDGDSKFL
jgi:hypothetical protein